MKTPNSDKKEASDRLDHRTASELRSEELRSEELLGRRNEVGIRHNGERYTLRITANNKLILTK